MDPRILEHAPWGLATDFIVMAEAGSNAHGTVLAKDGVDDVDYLGAYWPPPQFMLGLDKHEHWVEQFDELDITSYSLEKLVRLLAKANPNVLGLLWTPEHKIVHRSVTFDQLQWNRDLFVAKGPVYSAFLGYARDQMKKMTSGQLYQGYMGEKRRHLVDTYGYDIKNAAHLIRLLHMAIEFLNDGEMHIDRTGIDADDLMAIKRGEFTLQEIQTSAARLFELAEEAYQRSALPEKMDRGKIVQMLTEMQWSHLAHTHPG